MLTQVKDAPSMTATAASPVDFVSLSNLTLKARIARTISEEIVAGFRVWPVWVIMGWDDIRQRYRRSVLGPFWITLSMGAFILLLGIIYSRLFHMELEHYMPYLSVGYIVWGFMSAAINDSCIAFTDTSRIIKQIKLPYSVYVLRVVWRNFIIFLHTIVIYIPVAIVFKVEPSLTMLLAIPGLILVCVNLIWLTTVIAILSTRYRDIQPIVGTAVQLGMFATPIMWPISSLGNAKTRCRDQSGLSPDRDHARAAARRVRRTSIVAGRDRPGHCRLGAGGRAVGAGVAAHRLLALI